MRVEPVLHSPQTLICPWVATQTKDILLAFDSNRPLLLQGHRPRPWLQMASLATHITILESPVLPLVIVTTFFYFLSLPSLHNLIPHLSDTWGLRVFGVISGVVSGVLSLLWGHSTLQRLSVVTQ